MRSEIEALMRHVLEAEPTRSMRAQLLLDRIRSELGIDVSGVDQLMTMLAPAPDFVVLEAPKTVRETIGVESWSSEYDAVFARIGVAETRIMLVTDAQYDGRAASTTAELVARAVGTLATIASSSADARLRHALNDALSTADRCAQSMVMDASSTDSSTTPPRGLPRPAEMTRRAPRRSSRRLPTGGSR